MLPEGPGGGCPAESDGSSGVEQGRPVRATWCPATKDQGFGRREAPRRLHCRPGRRGRRGASRRRFKALAGVKHHVGFTVGPSGPGDVVPRDERSRLWRGGGTTSEPPNARPSRATWCPATKDQAFGRGEAPRLTRVDIKKKELTTNSPPPLFVVNSNHLLMLSALICIRHK